MDSDEAFHIGLPEYSVLRLSPDHAEALQALFHKCEDYFMVVEGEGPAPNAAEEELQSIPSEGPSGDRFLFGIVSHQGGLVGFLEGLRGYPEQPIWWIGLLLVLPEIRARGLGRRIITEFARYARARGGEAIMLGVVEDNEGACQFWKKIGFERVRVTEPRPFGRKVQRVIVMRKQLTDD